MRYLRDGFSVEAAIAKRRPVPEWFLDCPELLPGDEVCVVAFWDLSTERQCGMTLGPIPWSKAMLYGSARMGLRGPALESFWRMVRVIDEAYLGWMKEQHDRQVDRDKRHGKHAAPPSGKGSQRRTGRKYARG